MGMKLPAKRIDGNSIVIHDASHYLVHLCRERLALVNLSFYKTPSVASESDRLTRTRLRGRTSAAMFTHPVSERRYSYFPSSTGMSGRHGTNESNLVAGLRTLTGAHLWSRSRRPKTIRLLLQRVFCATAGVGRLDVWRYLPFSGRSSHAGRG